MKLAYLANVRFPSERAHAAQIAHMCQAFAEIGNEVTLYTNARGEGTLHSVAETFSIKPKFTLKMLPPGKLYGETKLGFLVRELLFGFSFWWRYRTAPQNIIYSRDEWLLYLLSFLLPRESYVYESHEAKYNRAVRRLVRRGVPMVVISEGIRDYYLSQGVPSEKLLVAHDAIDDSFLEPPISQTAARDTLGLPHDAYIAMYIGGFDAWKGVETFFKAAALLPEVLFVAIGGKPEEVEKYAVQYPQVRFLGARPYRELRCHQQAANVLVIPNTAASKLSAKYTSPLKLFAHMASGVPIVASDIPSVRNVVADGVTFFTPDDEQQLAKALRVVKSEYQRAAEQALQLQVQSRTHTWLQRAQVVTSYIENQK